MIPRLTGCGVLICDPGNPLGQKYDDARLLALLRKLDAAGVTVFFDSPYRRVFPRRDGHVLPRNTSVAQRGDRREFQQVDGAQRAADRVYPYDRSGTVRRTRKADDVHEQRRQRVRADARAALAYDARRTARRRGFQSGDRAGHRAEYRLPEKKTACWLRNFTASRCRSAFSRSSTAARRNCSNTASAACRWTFYARRGVGRLRVEVQPDLRIGSAYEVPRIFRSARPPMIFRPLRLINGLRRTVFDEKFITLYGILIFDLYDEKV